jgi:mannose-1-phosphate guanylyltransferase
LADCLADIDVVILAGGLGTRLRSVLADKPKVLAPVGARTFLDVLLDRLAAFGARRVILSLGHLAGEVSAHLAAHPRAGRTILPLVEPEPLGTAGAIRFVRPHLKSATALILNGDSLIDADLCAFVATHRAQRADGTLLCARVADAARYGTVDVTANGRIAAFREKTGLAMPGAINAGVYLMDMALLDRIGAGTGPSLERDVFQTMTAGTLAAHVGDFAFLDIGVPEDLAKVEAFASRLDGR